MNYSDGIAADEKVALRPTGTEFAQNKHLVQENIFIESNTGKKFQ